MANKMPHGMAIIAPSFHRSLCFALAISQWQSYQLPVTSSQFSLSLSPSPFHKLLPSLNASCILSFSSGSCLLLLLLKSATHFDAIKFAIRSDRWNNQWSLETSMGIYTKRVIEKCRRICFIRQRERREKEWSKSGAVNPIDLCIYTSCYIWIPSMSVYLLRLY